MIFKNLFVLISMLFAFNAFATFVPVAKIVKIKGTAFINTKKVEVGTEVSEGDEVRLSKLNEFVEIKYQNGHIMRLQGGILRITKLDPKNVEVSLLKGFLYNLVQKLSKDEKYKVVTPKASFGVRGTKFYIQESKSESYLCVCEGTVVASNGKDELNVSKNQDLFVNSSKPYKITNASKQMIKMGNDVFNTIGK